MKVLLFTSALLTLAAGDTCSDCTAVVSTIAERLTSEESIAAQQAIVLSSINVCLGQNDCCQQS